MFENHILMQLRSQLDSDGDAARCEICWTRALQPSTSHSGKAHFIRALEEKMKCKKID